MKSNEAAFMGLVCKGEDFKDEKFGTLERSPICDLKYGGEVNINSETVAQHSRCRMNGFQFEIVVTNSSSRFTSSTLMLLPTLVPLHVIRVCLGDCNFFVLKKKIS